TLPGSTTPVTTAFTAQTLTLTATVTAAGMGAGTPTGTVTFMNGNTALGTVPLDNTGTATFALRGLNLGANSLTAVYNPTGTFATSTSAAQTVQASVRSTVGTFDPTSGNWFLRNSNSAGPFDFGFVFGLPNWRPVVGSWNGSGVQTIGVVDP